MTLPSLADLDELNEAADLVAVKVTAATRGYARGDHKVSEAEADALVEAGVARYVE